MNEYKFPTICGALAATGLLMGLAGHGFPIALENLGLSDWLSPQLADACRITIWFATAGWMLAIATLAQRRGYSAVWGGLGAAMLFPFAALLPWLAFLLLPTRTREMSRAMKRGRDAYIDRCAGTGRFQIRQRTLEFDERFLDDDDEEVETGLWSMHVSTREPPSTANGLGVSPKVVRNQTAQLW